MNDDPPDDKDEPNIRDIIVGSFGDRRKPRREHIEDLTKMSEEAFCELDEGQISALDRVAIPCTRILFIISDQLEDIYEELKSRKETKEQS